MNISYGTTTSKMPWFTKSVAIVLGIMTFVQAEVFDRSFLVRIEHFTKTNKDLSDTNKALNDVVIAQQKIMANLTDKINELEMKNTEQEKTMTSINESISNCNCQNSKTFLTFLRIGKKEKKNKEQRNDIIVHCRCT